MPNHDTGRRERLDRRDSLRAEKPLQAVQRALAFEHKLYNRAFGRRLAASHRPERSRGSQRQPR